jgi:RimJ/RimL family protein N-acetyltransferase
MAQIETTRLTIRPFSPDDWKGTQELTINKMSPKMDPHDHDLPTDDEGCKKMAEWFAKQSDQFFAVFLKSNQRLIGFLTFNGVDDNQQLDVGHVIHTEFQDNDHDKEALEVIIDHAFAIKDIRSIVTRNPPDWEDQNAPLKALGFRLDDQGELAMGKADWEKSKKS